MRHLLSLARGFSSPSFSPADPSLAYVPSLRIDALASESIVLAVSPNLFVIVISVFGCQDIRPTRPHWRGGGLLASESIVLAICPNLFVIYISVLDVRTNG